MNFFFCLHTAANQIPDATAYSRDNVVMYPPIRGDEWMAEKWFIDFTRLKCVDARIATEFVRQSVRSLMSGRLPPPPPPLLSINAENVSGNGKQ